MSGSFLKDVITRAFKIFLFALLLAVLSPLLVCLALVTAMLLRFRRGPAPASPDVLEFAPRPGVRTMSEAMEFLERIPFGRRWPGRAAALLAASVDLMPQILDAGRPTSGFVYPYPRPFEPIMIESSDGTPVYGLLAMQPGPGTAPALVVVHDLFESKNSHAARALAVRAYYSWGFHVLTLDLRGAGDSGRFTSSPMTLGYRESEDVLSAASFLCSVERVTTVSACGFGAGGTAVTAAAAHSRLDGPVTGGAAAINSYCDARRQALRLSSGGSAPPLVKARARLMLLLRTSLNGPRRLADLDEYIRQVSSQYYESGEEAIYSGAGAAAEISDLEVPCLLLHSLNDRVVPVEEAYELVALALGNPMLGSLVVPGGGHALYRFTNRAWLYATLQTYFTYWGEFMSEQPEHDGIDIYENPDN